MMSKQHQNINYGVLPTGVLKLDSGLKMPHHTAMRSPLTRRQFARQLLFTTGALAAAPALLRGQNLNNKLNIAIIGTGGRGGGNLGSVASENIVALCDVNAKNLDAAAAKYPGARKAADFRKLFDRPTGFRRRGGEHVRTHSRLRHHAGAEAPQTCLLREAAHA